MPLKKRRPFTDAVLLEYQHEGRGEGSGDEYQPWVQVYDFYSDGQAATIPGIIHDRPYHTFSLGEQVYFKMLHLLYLPILKEINEQYPYPLILTQAIANAIHVKHPTDPKSKFPVLITTDFLFTLELGKSSKKFGRTVKRLSDLDKRTLEKFEIERRLYKSINIDWKIIIADYFPEYLAKNSITIYPHLNKHKDTEPHLLKEIITLFDALALEKRLSIKEMADNCDDKFGLPKGTCINYAYFLIGRRHWKIDLFKKIEESELMPITIGDNVLV